MNTFTLPDQYFFNFSYIVEQFEQSLVFYVSGLPAFEISKHKVTSIKPVIEVLKDEIFLFVQNKQMSTAPDSITLNITKELQVKLSKGTVKIENGQMTVQDYYLRIKHYLNLFQTEQYLYDELLFSGVNINPRLVLMTDNKKQQIALKRCLNMFNKILCIGNTFYTSPRKILKSSTQEGKKREISMFVTDAQYCARMLTYASSLPIVTKDDVFTI